MAGRSVVALLAEGVDRNFQLVPHSAEGGKSPSSRRAWIEIFQQGNSYRAVRSPSSRRAWIEILYSGPTFGPTLVALLAEGVDRNSEDDGALIARLNVALLAEGVDRNWASIAT